QHTLYESQALHLEFQTLSAMGFERAPARHSLLCRLKIVFQVSAQPLNAIGEILPDRLQNFAELFRVKRFGRPIQVGYGRLDSFFQSRHRSSSRPRRAPPLTL